MYLAVQELAQRTHDGPGDCLGRNQQVTWADACVDQLLARQAQNAVRARVPVALANGLSALTRLRMNGRPAAAIVN